MSDILQTCLYEISKMMDVSKGSNMSRALIVIDIQKFFLVAAPDDLVPKIVNDIKSSQYDVIAFTVFKNNPGSNLTKSLNWTKCDSDADTDLPGELTQYASKDNVFTRASYSGFSDTRLDEYLRSKEVTHVTLCGVDTDACVLATAFSAFDLGYKIAVNFETTYSNGELETEARTIMERSLIAQE